MMCMIVTIKQTFNLRKPILRVCGTGFAPIIHVYHRFSGNRMSIISFNQDKITIKHCNVFVIVVWRSPVTDYPAAVLNWTKITCQPVKFKSSSNEIKERTHVTVYTTYYREIYMPAFEIPGTITRADKVSIM